MCNNFISISLFTHPVHPISFTLPSLDNWYAKFSASHLPPQRSMRKLYEHGAQAMRSVFTIVPSFVHMVSWWRDVFPLTAALQYRMESDNAADLLYKMEKIKEIR